MIFKFKNTKNYFLLLIFLFFILTLNNNFLNNNILLAQDIYDDNDIFDLDKNVTDNTLSLDDEINDNVEIYVNIPAFKLRLISNGKVIKEYKIRVGRPEKKTITGVGSITRKFKTSYFRYTDGPNKGEIIRYSNIKDRYNGKVIKRIKIPYEKIRGLELEINGIITGQIIHATTNPETLGYACSSGCVGLSIDDMLDLYSKVNVGTKVLIEYNPVEFEDNTFYFYKDIYKQNPNYHQLVEELLSFHNIPYTDKMIDLIVKTGLKQKKVTLDEINEKLRDWLNNL